MKFIPIKEKILYTSEVIASCSSFLSTGGKYRDVMGGKQYENSDIVKDCGTPVHTISQRGEYD
jgi:hypothetical protein